MINKISIGTANFGMKYGIGNGLKIKSKKIENILNYAKLKKIKYIDTAYSYGNAHKILGKVGVQDFQVSSKLPIINKDILDIDKFLNKSVEKTLKDLNINTIDTLFLHNVDILNSSLKNKIILFLKKLKKDKIIKRYGFSIYTKKDFFDTVDSDPDVLQLPMNFFNRNFEDNLIKKQISNRKIRIEARSIFLQGILLTNNYPKKFFKTHYLILKRWNNWIENNKISKIDACLNYINSQKFIKKTILGIDSVSHLKEVLFYKKYKNLLFPNNLQSNNINLIDPRKWNDE